MHKQKKEGQTPNQYPYFKTKLMPFVQTQTFNAERYS